MMQQKTSNQTNRTYKKCFINNIEKGSIVPREVFNYLTNKTPLKIIKVSFRDEVDNQQKFSSNYKIQSEPGYNDILSHPFLSDYIFKERVPILSDIKSKDERIEVFSEEEKDLNEIKAFIDFFMGSYIREFLNETTKLYSLKEDLEKIKGKKNNNKSLSTFKEKERNVEIELWASEAEENEYENKKIFFPNNSNTPAYIKFKVQNTTNSNNNSKNEDMIQLNKKLQELKIIGLNKQFEKTQVSLEDLDFGEFLPNKNTFMSFFSLKTLKTAWRAMDIPIESIIPEFYYSSQEKTKSQKLFLIISLLAGYEMKIEFSYKFCKEIVFDRENDDYINLYANLLIPPRISIQNPNKAQYEAPYLRMSWPRVHNFFILEHPLIDEIHRIYLMNNTVLKMKFHISNEIFLKHFQEKIKNMGILKKRKSNIKYQLFDNKIPLLTSQILQQLSFKDIHISFNVKYNLLCLLTENKISVYDPEVFDLIKDLPNLSPDYLEMTIEDLCKILPRGFFSDETNSFQEIFKNVLKRKKRGRGLDPRNSFFHILKTSKITLTPSGIIYSQKEPEMSNRVLRKYEKDLNFFLRVKFADDDLDDTKNMKFVIYKYFKPQIENFLILGRKYEFMAFSASQLRTSSCWMFSNQDSKRTVDSIINKLGKFKDKIAAKKAARIGQSFSASYPIVLTDMNLNILTIDDIEVSKGVFSDGIGKISQDLIDEICMERRLTNIASIQIRFGGAKGVLSVDPYMKEEKTICLRPSMVKFEGKYRDLEILDYNKYRGGYLNRQIILLLVTLGVPDKVFRDLQNEYLLALENCTLKDANIFQYFNAEFEGQLVEIPPITHLIRQLKNAQFSLDKDPFLLGIEKTLRLRGLLLLKKKSNILVTKAARLLGVLDEYGVLAEDEVCVRVQVESDGKKEKIVSIESNVIITRNPCLHPGDIRVMKAVKQPKLDHLTNCVVFPQKGIRPITSMISGGDLDGDLYFVSWDERLLPSQTEDAMSYESKKNEEFNESSEIKVQQMLDFFIKYMNFDNLGRIANSHLALADQSEKLAYDERCLKLAELHSDAVDFVKTGVCIENIDKKLLAKEWPDFMEKKDYLLIYESATVLGELFREMKKIIKGKKDIGEISNERTELDLNYPIDMDLVYGNWEEFINPAFDIFEDFQIEMNGLLGLFNIRNEFEVYSGNFSKFTKEERKGKVNVELLQKRVLDHIVVIKKRFEFIFEEGMNGNEEKLKEKASAVYLISYLNNKHKDEDEYQKMFKNVFANKKWKNFEENERKRIIGLPWMVMSKWLIQIKQQKTKKDKNIEHDKMEDEEFLE